MANKNLPANEKVAKLKKIVNLDSVQEQFQNALDENAGSFIASIIDLYGSDNYLQNCNPKDVVMEALKAATLNLPINKQLGFAYIVPYGNTPTFQIGYKGYIQLAMRTGQYRHLNADRIYEGEEIIQDRLTGSIEIEGEKESEKVVGYFAYMELTNGFSKAVFMTKDEVEKHGKRYSKSYSNKSSAWQTNFEQMALKTVVRRLLSKYGILSTEMISALSEENKYSSEEEVQQEVGQNANQGDYIDVDVQDSDQETQVPPEETAATEDNKEQPKQNNDDSKKKKESSAAPEEPPF